jgi:hypothetical protein
MLIHRTDVMNRVLISILLLTAVDGSHAIAGRLSDDRQSGHAGETKSAPAAAAPDHGPAKAKEASAPPADSHSPVKLDKALERLTKIAEVSPEHARPTPAPTSTVRARDSRVNSRPAPSAPRVRLTWRASVVWPAEASDNAVTPLQGSSESSTAAEALPACRQATP